MIGMVALLMLAASCKKDKKDEIENAGSGFRATVESHAGDSKTHLDGLAVKWDSGDAILVKSSTCTTPRGFTTQESGDNVNFDANTTLPDDFYAPPYTGYYPAAAFSGDQLTLPATQTYVTSAATFANGANPMAATSSETLLPFKNICGVLKLQLHSETACNVNTITITSNTGEQLWGTGTVGFDTDNKPTLSALSNGGSRLTLSCGGMALSTNASSPSIFFFVVPAHTLGTKFTVMVTFTNGEVWTKEANATQNLIARSQITVLPSQPVTPRTPVRPSTVTVTAGCSSEFIYNVGGSVTLPEGEHTCEFGLVYSETNVQPTVADSKIVAGTATFSGTQSFTADLTGLTVGTTYHVRAYAMIEGVAYSTEVKDIVGGNVPQAMTWTDGKSPKPFSVSATKKVYFSQGNLQYNAAGSFATAASGENVGGTWRFAEHQFDFIGTPNENAAQTYTGWIDLFGWGTSGNNHGATCYQPWSTTQNNDNYLAYGISGNHLYSSNGKADWGKANTIYAGTTPTTGWRTLIGGSGGEWDYLINSRNKAANLYGKGKVGSCTPGLIILPDDWSWSGDVEEFGPNVADENRKWKPGNTKWANVYSYSEWAKMEAAGAVFLPAAGERNDTSVSSVGSYGYYWSSLFSDTGGAYRLRFCNDEVYPAAYNDHRCYGFSVRLVSDN